MRGLDPQREPKARVESTPLRWILASASPRRRELLGAAGQDFEIVPSAAAEVPLEGEAPEEMVRRLATVKALDVSAGHPGRFVLGADTVVAIDGSALGKPANDSDARRMLALLSGREHLVITGYAIVIMTMDAGAQAREVRERRSVTSVVRFRVLSPDEIDAYVSSGEPSDKAGAYAIQGGAAGFVAELRGSWTNVVGLPMDEVAGSMRRLGLWRDRLPRDDVAMMR